MKNKIFILHIINFLLFIIYILSFFIFSRELETQNKNNILKMYLLNTKENIINIEIHNKTIDKENEILILNTKDNIGTFIEQNIEPIIFPLDNIKINTFLQYLRNLIRCIKFQTTFLFRQKTFIIFLVKVVIS